MFNVHHYKPNHVQHISTFIETQRTL
uniref:Uncharacterized protein n=1 Tax=Anguilla anguilla TaxID=7936 RepID=A0A0E9U0T9_ANGAN